MNRALKIILIIIAVLILVLIAAVVAAKVYFTSDRLKALVIPKVEQATGKKVDVGSISLSIFPKFSVKLKGLTITNPPGAPFDRPDLASLDELGLDVAIMPLLHQEVQVNKIELVKPRLYLETNKEGLTNYAMPKAPPSQSQKQAPSAFALLVPDLRVSNGHVEYVDKKADQRILLAGLNQRMSVGVTGGGAQAAIEGHTSIDSASFGTVQKNLISRLPVKSYQKLTYNIAQDNLTLDSLDLAIEQISLSGHGTVEHMQTLPVVDLAIRSNKADLGQLLSLVPKEYLKASQGLKTTGTFQFALTAKGEADSLHQPAVTGTFAVNDGSIQYQGLPKAVTGINIRGAFDMPSGSAKQPPPGQLNIEQMSAKLGTSSLNGNLKVVNFQNPVMNAAFNASIDLGEVKDYYPLEKGTAVSGGLKAQLAINGPAKDPTGLKAQGRMDLQNVMVQSPASERPLKNLNGSITFNNQFIDAKNLTVDIGQSDMALNFSMRNYLGLVMKSAAPTGRPIVTASLNSRQLRTADLPQTKPEPGAPPEKKKGGPVLPDMDITANLAVGKLITEKFEFDNVKATAHIVDGVITLQNFSTNTLSGMVTTKGMLDLKPGARAFDLNLNLSNLSANDALSKFTNFGNYIFGKFNLTGSMKGSLNDTMGLNAKSLIGDGKVVIDGGKLTGLPLTNQLASFTGLNQFKQMTFDNWTNSFSINAGRMQLPDLKIKAGNLDIIANGTQGLDGSCDYHLTLAVPQSMINQLNLSGLPANLLNFMKDKQGKIDVPLLVTGSINNPALSLDQQQIQKMATQGLQQQATSKADSATEALKKKAQEGLENLFKKKP